MIIIDNEYITVKDMGRAEIVEKRSRFIANVRPVSTEEEALEYLNTLRQKYWDARHNVFAYIIRENNIMRYSDDGEPSGTAGVPVLEILKKENLTDVIVVVTRYFGGILLGTGGLVHAYSKAAKEGIASAQIQKMILCRKINIKCDYTLLGKLQYEIAEFKDAFLGEVSYGEEVIIEVFVKADMEDSFVAMLTEKTSASVTIEKLEIDYFEQD